jgi:Tol biopolymer transport system component
MTDERIDALIRRLDVPADADPDFVRSTYAALLPRARAARASDASRIGRLWRDLRLVRSSAHWPSTARPVGIVGLVILLILASLLAILVAGALNRFMPIRNGPLIVSIHGQLQAIDVGDGSVRSILQSGDKAQGVSRSPDGRLVTFWTIAAGRSHLYVVDVNGQNRRELAPDLSLGWTDTIDVWSPDSRFLATEVTLDGQPARILVADVAAETATPLTPRGLSAHNPLWSPDGRWIAFTEVSSGIRSLAVIRNDGTDKRSVSGDVVGVAGPDTWSPDGTWIYFNSADGGVYRANVAGGFSQLLIGNGRVFEAAYAPASSPDGTLIVFIVPRSDRLGYDLWVATSDGSGAHRLLERATHDGWSSDGRYVIVEWTPANQAGGLAVVTPDGGSPQVLLPFDAVCQHGPRCTDGVGWGQPRP